MASGQRENGASAAENNSDDQQRSSVRSASAAWRRQYRNGGVMALAKAMYRGVSA